MLAQYRRMRLLPSVLSTTDLPEAELHAARLDGELVRVGDCFSAVDEIITAAHRAGSLAVRVPGRLIAERLTAAWVWGAIVHPPPLIELCSDISARYRLVAAAGRVPREVVFAEGEVVELAGLRLTSPLRTALDLARVTVAWSPEHAETLARLAALGRFGMAEVQTSLEARRHLPYKARALARATTSLARPGAESRAVYPALTR